MSNLPQDPNSPVTSDNDQDVTVSGKGPESGAIGVERPTPPEVQKPPETISSLEKTPVPKPAGQEPPAPQQGPQTENATEDPPKVVDKTDEITTLHEIKDSKDKLTKEADEEEEHFIEEVEKHHGRL